MPQWHVELMFAAAVDGGSIEHRPKTTLDSVRTICTAVGLHEGMWCCSSLLSLTVTAEHMRER